MKFFTLTALLAAALASAVVVVPFLPAAKKAAAPFALEVQLRSTVTSGAQLFYDRGLGILEADSSRVPVTAGATAGVYRLPLAAGTFRTLRFDPLECAGTIVIESLRVLTEDGRLVRPLAPANLRAVEHIASRRLIGDQLEVVVAEGETDPQLELVLDPPLRLTSLWWYIGQIVPRAAVVFATLAALLFLIDRVALVRTLGGRAARWAKAHPHRGVALVAALAVALSAYPVVLLGRSYVSPNLGTVLLYDNFPTLPGYHAAEITDVKLADVGAIMWSHIPLSMIQHRALAQGELPLWNRYNSAGTPLLAQGQSMFGDPLHLVVVLANGASWAWDLKFLVAKWLFATALGLLVLAVTRHQPAALLVTLSAPFIGFFLYRYNHPAIFSVCYAPAVLYGWLRVVEAGDRRAAALWIGGLMVANLALMNSGTAKEAYMLLVCINFSGACVLLAAAASWRARLAKLAAVAWAGTLFVLLTAPVWAAFLHTLKNAFTTYNLATAYQIQPTLLLGAFDEIFFRPLMAEDRVFNPSLNFLLLLGLLGFLATLRLHFSHRTAMALAVSTLPPLALAYGLVPPEWIVRVPFLGNVAHLDNTFTCVLLVLWSVLAGVGFATAASRLGTREGRGDLVGAGLLLFALVFGWIAFGQAAHRWILGPTFTVNQPGTVLPVSFFIWDYLAALLIACGALAWVAQRALVRQSLTPALALIGGTAIVVLLWRHGFHGESVGFETYAAHPTERVDFQARSEAMEFARTAQAAEPGRGFGLHGNFFPGWTPAYGLETIHGPDALVNPFLRDLITASGVERQWNWRLYAIPATVAKARPFFDVLNVRWYFNLPTTQPLSDPTLRLVKSADLDVFESPTAWPRAFFTDRLAGYDEPADFVAQLKAGDGRPFAAMQNPDLVAQPTLRALSRDLASRAVAPAKNYRLTENTTAFEVHATGPGVIVLTETVWPGDFRVEVNGTKRPVLRLNHAFKGVAVEAAGDYRVIFRYWPRNFTLLLGLSGLGALLLAASFVIAWRRPRTA